MTDELLVDLNSITISDYMYMLSNQAHEAAELLAAQVDKAVATLSHLRNLQDMAEDAGQLIASSDLQPNSYADPPKNSGLVRTHEKPGIQMRNITVAAYGSDDATIPYLDN